MDEPQPQEERPVIIAGNAQETQTRDSDGSWDLTGNENANSTEYSFVELLQQCNSGRACGTPDVGADHDAGFFEDNVSVTNGPGLNTQGYDGSRDSPPGARSTTSLTEMVEEWNEYPDGDLAEWIAHMQTADLPGTFFPGSHIPEVDLFTTDEMYAPLESVETTPAVAETLQPLGSRSMYPIIVPWNDRGLLHPTRITLGRKKSSIPVARLLNSGTD